MRLTRAQTILTVVLSAALCWSLIQQHHGARVHSDRLRVLETASVGIHREDVVEALGRPHHEVWQAPGLMMGDASMLSYRSWGHSRQDFAVILDADDRVVGLYYPAHHPGIEHGVRIVSPGPSEGDAGFK